MASLFDIIMSEEDGPNIFDYSNDSLAGLEKFAGNLLGVTDILNYAGGRPVEMGYQGVNRGKADALRHLLLSAELERQHPMIAGPLLFGHEYVTNLLQGQREDERNQDLRNNELGRSIGRKAKSREEVESMARSLIDRGEASVLPELGRGEY